MNKQSENPSVRPDQAWKALALVNEWIRHAEAKTVATLAATGVATGVLYNICKDWSSPPLIGCVLAVGGGVVLFAAFICCAGVLVPRLQIGKWSRKPSKDLGNLLFFRDIAVTYKEDGPSYVDVLCTLTGDDDQLTRHIAAQVHANATVAHAKYWWADAAIFLLAGGVALLALTAFTRVLGA